MPVQMQAQGGKRMANKELPRREWRPFFDFLSKAVAGQNVEVEVVGLNLGDQIEQDWLRLKGLTYGPKDDIFYVYTEGLDHMIRSPSQIFTDWSGTELRVIEVYDKDNRSHIIKLKDSLLLEPSSGQERQRQADTTSSEQAAPV